MTNPRVLLRCLFFFTLVAVDRSQAQNNDTSVVKLRLDKFVMPEFPDFVRLTGNNKRHTAQAEHMVQAEVANPRRRNGRLR